MKKRLVICLISVFCLLSCYRSVFALKQNKSAKFQLSTKSSKVVICAKVIQALGAIGDPAAKEVFIKGFRSQDFLVRVAATEALNMLNDPQIIPLLENALDDESYLIRILAVKALWNLGQPGMESRLLEFLGSEQESARAAAVEQLGQLDYRYLPRLVDLLSQDKSNLVRMRAIQQLGINRYHPAIGMLKQALNDPDPRIRQAACIALGRIRDPETLPFIMAKLADEKPIVRAAAKEATALFDPVKPQEMLGPEGTGLPGEDKFLILLKKELGSKDPSLKVSSFLGLANLKQVSVFPLLLKEVILPENSTLIKKGAARALWILKPYVIEFFNRLAEPADISSSDFELNYKVNGQSLLSFIIQALEDETNPLHLDSVFILGELREEASLPALRRALRQNNPEIVANAAYVLGQFRDKEAVIELINLYNRIGL